MPTISKEIVKRLAVFENISNVAVESKVIKISIWKPRKTCIMTWYKLFRATE
jgi:hypothetical protein